MASTQDDQRQRIARLVADRPAEPMGLQGTRTPVASFEQLVLALQGVDAGDLAEKLRISRFMVTAFVLPEDPEQILRECSSCMYYERHRRFCALPELMLAVEPRWSCLLWRI